MEAKKYELGVIIRADLEDDGFRTEMERVKGLVERFGGTIEKVDEWGRRKLAYPIQKLTEGMYTFITYTSAGLTPSEVESRLRLMESVLRFMTVCKEEPEVAAKQAVVQEEVQPTQEVVEQPKPELTPEPVVENTVEAETSNDVVEAEPTPES